MSQEDKDRPAIGPAPQTNPYTPGKLFGVALAGASAGLFLYYMYQHLEPEEKKKYGGGALKKAKAQLREWVKDEPPEDDYTPPEPFGGA
ncbi:hypothetical protein JST97_24615 [bacterium]|nr:hypothetical protein [bacterium]